MILIFHIWANVGLDEEWPVFAETILMYAFRFSINANCTARFQYLTDFAKETSDEVSEEKYLKTHSLSLYIYDI